MFRQRSISSTFQRARNYQHTTILQHWCTPTRQTRPRCDDRYHDRPKYLGLATTNFSIRKLSFQTIFLFHQVPYCALHLLPLILDHPQVTRLLFLNARTLLSYLGARTLLCKYCNVLFHVDLISIHIRNACSSGFSSSAPLISHRPPPPGYAAPSSGESSNNPSPDVGQHISHAIGGEDDLYGTKAVQSWRDFPLDMVRVFLLATFFVF